MWVVVSHLRPDGSITHPLPFFSLWWLLRTMVPPCNHTLAHGGTSYLTHGGLLWPMMVVDPTHDLGSPTWPWLLMLPIAWPTHNPQRYSPPSLQSIMACGSSSTPCNLSWPPYDGFSTRYDPSSLTMVPNPLPHPWWPAIDATNLVWLTQPAQKPTPPPTLLWYFWTSLFFSWVVIFFQGILTIKCCLVDVWMHCVSL